MPGAMGTAQTHDIGFGEAVRTWARIAALSFGGPAGQIAVMHRVVVDEKKWVGEARFLHALNYCMLLPGPEAQQLATYLGWLMHGVRGGLAAGLLFILPGAVAIMGLSIVYALYGKTDFVSGLFFGLKAAVLAIVLQAVVRLGKRALKGGGQYAIAAAAFAAIFVFDVPFPLIILGAGVIGWLAFRDGAGGHEAHGGLADRDSALGETLPAHATADKRRTWLTAAIILVAWLAPVAALWLTRGPGDVFTRIATFFSQMAVVTFGGAYAVLAYVAQQAVETYGWLESGEMLDGLGMAETTPGPLIMVLQFVGFGKGESNRLIADHMEAVFQSQFGRRKVQVIGCNDRYKIHPLGGGQIFFCRNHIFKRVIYPVFRQIKFSTGGF